MDHYGLIGNPVSHSLSEKYFTDKFLVENVAARYERFLLKDIEGLTSLLSSYPRLRGLNVTSPFKTSVIAHCDALDDTAKDIGAVNTLKIFREGGKVSLTGYNTDADGFAAALLPLTGSKRPPALILGSGGAARAVAYAMAKLGIGFKVVSRLPGKGKITYEEIDAGLVATHKLIVNATPLGMISHPGEYPPIPYHRLTSGHLLFDLNYNPPETPFLLKGKRQGCRTVNGLLMLQAQAEKAWEIWQET
jgi:shikimate dehydrogenase